MNTVKLTRLAMVRFNNRGIYAPSRLRPTIEMSEREFLEKYANRQIEIQVSFAPDGYSDPVTVTAYDRGLEFPVMIKNEVIK